MMAILLKFVVFFCLFGHHMSVTFSIRFTPDREHYAVNQIVQFVIYFKNMLTKHKRSAVTQFISVRSIT